MSVRAILVAAAIAMIAGSAIAADVVLPATTEVDLSALRYYASRNETQRVEAEIRRLRSLYPGWQPPADPSVIPAEEGPSDEKLLWELFGADRADELRKAIDERKAADPSWTVPPELEQKMALKQTRRQLIDASNKGDYAAVVALVDKTPALVTMDDLDVAWRAAEARGRMGQDDKALDLHKEILSATTDPAARLATVQKAMAVLKPNELQGLLSLGRKGPDGRSEFDAVETDLIRQHIGRVLAGGTTDDVTQAEIERLSVPAKVPGSGAEDAALLGWLSGQRKEFAAANDWFQIALAASPDPAKGGTSASKAAQGAAMALNALGRTREAEELAYRWRERDPALTLLFLSLVEPDLTRPTPVPIDQERLLRYSQIAIAQQSGSAAQALGWYAYNIGQVPTALAWFQKGMAWQPRDTTALGLALSLQRLGDVAGLKAFIEQNLATYPTLASVINPTAVAQPVALDRSIPRQAAAPLRAGVGAATSGASRGAGGGEGRGGGGGPMAAAYRAKDYGRCLTIAAQLEASGRLDHASALQKGWCLMALNRPQEAAIAFSSAQGNAGTASDAAYGEALARLRSGQTMQAAAAANSAPLASKQRNEIGIGVLAQQAAAAFDAGQYRSTLELLNQRRMYVAESRDLSVLRGWSLHHLGYREEAQQVFATLDRQLSTKDTRTGLAVTSQRKALREDK